MCIFYEAWYSYLNTIFSENYLTFGLIYECFGSQFHNKVNDKGSALEERSDF